MSGPLLVVDGDSLAHRAYHGLPKTTRRSGNRGAGAIVGFTNFLLRLHKNEQPRAVLVGWDTLDAPTYRHQAFEGYQAGRTFDDELIDQLGVLPEFVEACGFANAKAPGYEADDFLSGSRRTLRPTRSRRDWGPRCLPARIGADDHLVPDPSWRDGSDRPVGGQGALWRRSCAGARLHCLAG